MKIGKLPEAVLKRSVLTQLHTRRDEVQLSAAIGEDCAALALEADEMMVLSTDPITASTAEIGTLAVQVTLNDLASSGAEPVGIMVTLLLPPDTTEDAVRQVMMQMEKDCADANVEIMGGHTEVTDAVNRILVSVCGVGKVKKDSLVTTAGVRPGMDLIATKWIALEGTAILAKGRETELLKRFPEELIQKAKEMGDHLSVRREAAVAVQVGVGAMHDVTEGGIYGALWEFAEASGVGLVVELKKIPIRQETIEICEYFGLNPYELISSGCMLMATEHGEELVQSLQAEGIPASIIGKATVGNDRIIENNGEKRFLTPPSIDEIYKVMGADSIKAGI